MSGSKVFTDLSKPLIITDMAKFKSACRAIVTILLYFDAIKPAVEPVIVPYLISNTDSESRNNSEPQS